MNLPGRLDPIKPSGYVKPKFRPAVCKMGNAFVELVWESKALEVEMVSEAFTKKQPSVSKLFGFLVPGSTHLERVAQREFAVLDVAWNSRNLILIVHVVKMYSLFSRMCFYQQHPLQHKTWYTVDASETSPNSPVNIKVWPYTQRFMTWIRILHGIFLEQAVIQRLETDG